MTKGKHPAYNVRAIVKNVELVFKDQDIERLNNPTYKFIILHMGFIAHYDLHGFQHTYVDLRGFASKLQTSEYSNDSDYNLRQATKQETDKQFCEWYGTAYNKSIAEAIRGIVDVVRRYEKEIASSFGLKQKQEELAFALSLADKHGYELKIKGGEQE